MFNAIDQFLNRTTMYRLVLYCLLILLAIACIFAFLGILPFNPLALIFGTGLLIAACWLSNRLFAWIMKAPSNEESVFITALILALIISPAFPTQGASIWLMIWASVFAMASKYVIALRKKQIFNPAAFGVALLALTTSQSATWWVGTFAMLPFVLILGALIVRKIHRWHLVMSFFIAALVTILFTSIGHNPILTLRTIAVDSPIFFFAFVMLTEPFTTPPTRAWQMVYGALTGVLFAPAVHIGSLYTTPELALLAANIFSYAVSPKGRHVLTLIEKIKTSADTYDFIFKPDRAFSFIPGQYLEWTLAHASADNRGIRRYFTIASSPTESNVRVGVKFYTKSSSYKKNLLAMKEGESLVGAQLAGDFTLPKNTNQKLVFIAGGIGITPFRSMIQYLIDQKERRDMILLYSNKIISEITYADTFSKAHDQLGLKIIYTLTDLPRIPKNWSGHSGQIDARMVMREIPDYRNRLFYISGPHAMVVGM
ncbi:MAG TPA: RnfABCDGE type electron transport complex subunit D, partial [Patescibacteria group bacterium]|nr:RnfABCDGE type electron transport complex subunit D [Patescibacteria group bacterium]